MKAWLLEGVYDLATEAQPLNFVDVRDPIAKPNEVLLRVTCCGVCHTEIDEIEGRTPPREYPVIPGHQVIGRVVEKGQDCRRLNVGDRVGVAWISGACGRCEYCAAGYENLCNDFIATGRDQDGGYAEWMTVDERFAYPIPEIFSDEQAAPLLCAGAIGYRSLRLTEFKDGQILALSGFGASGHLVLKTAKFLFPHARFFVFARSKEEQEFALQQGCDWAGDYVSKPPSLVNAVIDTTPAWTPVITSLSVLKPGGRLVINAIRKEAHDQQTLASINYNEHLWMEKEIKSVANITRSDVEEFLKAAAEIPITPEIQTYPFRDANEALIDLKRKHVRGAKVLVL